MDQALSLWFLLGWIGGDSCNLIGSFLADQLPLQVGPTGDAGAGCQDDCGRGAEAASGGSLAPVSGPTAPLVTAPRWKEHPVPRCAA